MLDSIKKQQSWELANNAQQSAAARHRQDQPPLRAMATSGITDPASPHIGLQTPSNLLAEALRSSPRMEQQENKANHQLQSST